MHILLRLAFALAFAMPALAEESVANIDYCLAKDNGMTGSEHREMMQAYGFDCAVVYWKLSSADNRANPYAWVRDHYQSNGIPTVMTLLIGDDETETVGTSEGAAVSTGVPGLLFRVLNGEFDDDLLALATAIKKEGSLVIIRPFHELDGGWYPWGIYAQPMRLSAPQDGFALEQLVYEMRSRLNQTTTNSSALAMNAVAHVVRLFDIVGADNVEWEINFNRRDGTGQVLADAEYLIPQLEAIGIDAYSISSYNRCGSSVSYPEQLSFAAEFAPIYDRLTLLTDKPIRVAETSTTDFCAPKGPWFEQMAIDLETRFPRVETVTLLFGTVPVGAASNDFEIDWSCGDNLDCISTLKSLLLGADALSVSRPVARPERP